MTHWIVQVPRRLYPEFAHLSPGGRRAVHDALARLAEDPRDAASTAEPVKGAELRRFVSEPATDTGDRITLLYRVHEPKGRTPGRVEIIFLLAGP
ncbi:MULTISPECIES: hypothetical protein [Streptomyces]|uniref:Uncharacterized protein n=1 Tax=Streptomyces solicathayae TaxID=3081768 RepID=A0ABZ0M451_9ACTN|nr:hypothetical protein [Streptomyces sp. HUAS YS2]WOX26401.1 hypothetical protein R2D22_35520 [Streptomyces sp. HUAS YS2]